MAISDQLKHLILTCGKSRYQISKESGVPEPSLHHFMHGTRTLSQSSIDKLCAHFNLILVSAPRDRRKERSSSKDPGLPPHLRDKG